MSPYAEGTEVPVERSRAEIERLVSRYGADQFMSAYDASRSIVGFRASGRMVRFLLPLPKREDFAINKKLNHWNKGYRRTKDATDRLWQSELRRRWRALLLVIKAKLESVESGVETFDEAFMAQVMLPDGSTVGQFMAPQIQASYENGGMPQLLPGHVEP